MSELLTMTNAIRNYLEELDWEKSHSDIFIALTKRGEQTVLQLSRVLSRPRSSLYLELEEMSNLGLVTVRKEPRSTKYTAIPIQSIKNILEVKQQKLTSLFDSFDEFVARVKDDTEEFKQKYEIVMYKGQEGVKQLLWNILTSDVKEVVGFSPGTLEYVVDRAFAEDWRLEFKNRNKYNRIIVNKTIPLTWSNIPGFLKKYVEVRTLEEKKIKFDHEVWFYGDTLILISGKDDPNQYGLEISDSLLVSSYRQLFDLVWNEIAKKVV